MCSFWRFSNFFKNLISCAFVFVCLVSNFHLILFVYAFVSIWVCFCVHLLIYLFVCLCIVRFISYGFVFSYKIFFLIYSKLQLSVWNIGIVLNNPWQYSKSLDANNFLVISILILLLCGDILSLKYLVQPMYAYLQFSHFIIYYIFWVAA